MTASYVTVKSPNFLIALVLDDDHRPSSSEKKELRTQTAAFFRDQLKAVYSSLDDLDLAFDEVVIGRNKDVDARFNATITVSAEARFKSAAATIVPSAERLFTDMMGSNSLDYLSQYVRKVNRKSPFYSASEVMIHRLAHKTGGRVQAPPFCVAFVCPNGPSREPTATEVAAFKETTVSCVNERLKEAFGDKYRGSLEFSVGRVEINTKRLPEDRFNLYLECEASADFEDSPTPVEFFHAMMMGTCSDYRYLAQVLEVQESPFALAKEVAMRVVDLDLPEVQVDDDAGGAGVASPENDDRVQVRVPPFYAALALLLERPGRQPNPAEVSDFKVLLKKVFFAVLKRAYPDTFVGFSLSSPAVTKFKAGLPAKRFNFYIEYSDAKAHFKSTDKQSIPTANQLLMAILKCNVSSVLAHVRKLDPIAFSQATEVTMRPVPSKEKTKPFAAKLSKNSDMQQDVPQTILVNHHSPEDTDLPALEALDDSTEQPSDDGTMQEHIPSDMPALEGMDEDTIELPSEMPTLDSYEDEDDDDESYHEESDEEESKEGTKGVEPQEDEATEATYESSTVPRNIELPVAMNDNCTRVQSSDFFVALKVSGEPTPADYEKLRQRTHDFFIDRLKAVFPETFVDMNLQIGQSEFGSGKPEPRYNCYVEWDIQASFVSGSSTAEIRNGQGYTAADGSEIPGPIQICKALVDAKYFEYLSKYVRTIEDTAFANATAVVARQTYSDNVAIQ